MFLLLKGFDRFSDPSWDSVFCGQNCFFYISTNTIFPKFSFNSIEKNWQNHLFSKKDEDKENGAI